MVSKSQLAQRIAARGATPAQAAHAVDAVLGEITAALAAGEKVTLVGFGSFEPVARAARTARNPRTGQSVPVAAATVPRFHPGAALRAAVDGGGLALGPVGALADGHAPAAPAAVEPAAPATGRGGAKAAGKAAKGATPAKASKEAKGSAPAKAPKPTKASARAGKDDKRKGKDAKGKKSGKKK